MAETVKGISSLSLMPHITQPTACASRAARTTENAVGGDNTTLTSNFRYHDYWIPRDKHKIEDITPTYEPLVRCMSEMSVV